MPEYAVKAIITPRNQKGKERIMKKEPMKAATDWSLCNPHKLMGDSVMLTL